MSTTTPPVGTIMNRDAWLAFGIEAGFCTSVYCDTHDGWAPEDDARQEALMDDFSTDHCTFIVRIKDQPNDE